MTKVKICGLMELEHVKVAVQSGADAVGFVFAKSRRQVTVEHAKLLATVVPIGVLKIGVFVNETLEEVERIAREVPLDVIQLHGDENPEYVRRVSLPTIKALSITTLEDVKNASRFDVDYFLFDAPGVEFRGGSGHSFDWTLLAKANISNDKVILAGGLTENNISEAIHIVKPFMVDVSSGVETEQHKDGVKIRTFIRTVKDEER
ncbi:phosphoribosylanthranilate isomerase [Paenisporosarcina antarctica]|uniref:N-(5'-phosphoribosyl)anthranilate isomerase n=1 Tax=Paenisporosarcina antarctica TaxID=417367 RepID=A0A4P7A2C5_9BACL|nr:phosphoribosylanthranilate isomerase [Paenisporosarcina antarctica]QBP42808.1 phosphoribosylanthranilate isomerase [Paenisporosarcina antarctica]